MANEDPASTEAPGSKSNGISSAPVNNKPFTEQIYDQLNGLFGNSVSRILT